MLLINTTIADKGAAARLKAIREKLGNIDEILADIGQIIESNTQQRFDTKTDPNGYRWKDWADSTRKAREDEGRGTLLVYTGQMRDSLISRVFGESLEVGYASPYAQFHEEGTSKMPRRAALLGANGTLGVKDRNEIYNTLDRHLREI